MLRFSHLTQTVKKVIICFRFGWIHCIYLFRSFYFTTTGVIHFLCWCDSGANAMTVREWLLRCVAVSETSLHLRASSRILTSSFLQLFSTKQKKEYTGSLPAFQYFNINKCILLCYLQNCNTAIKPFLFISNHHKHAFHSFVNVAGVIVYSQPAYTPLAEKAPKVL